MQRVALKEIALIGNTDDMKSFMQTYKKDFKLKTEYLPSILRQYNTTFFHMGFAFYLSDEFQFEHLSLGNIFFNIHIKNKNFEVAIVVNPSEIESAEIEKLKKKVKIEFITITHKDGVRMSEAELDDLMIKLKHASSIVPANKIKQEDACKVRVNEGEEDDFSDNEGGIKMQVFSKR